MVTRTECICHFFTDAISESVASGGGFGVSTSCNNSFSQNASSTSQGKDTELKVKIVKFKMVSQIKRLLDFPSPGKSYSRY